MTEATPSTVELEHHLQRELSEIGIAIATSQTVALPPKGHVLTPKDTALRGGVDFRIMVGGGIQVVGIPISNDAHGVESSTKIVRDGGAEQLARMQPRMPDRQAANLIATSSVGAADRVR